MKERPILFRPELVREILVGRKTVTRRPVKLRGGGPARPNSESTWRIASDSLWHPFVERTPLGEGVACPYGAPGDRLWVRETFWIEHDTEWSEASGTLLDCGVTLADPGWRVQFPATPSNSERPEEPGDWFGPDEFFPERTWCPWGDGGFVRAFSKRPGIHMPRWACRLVLEVASVRVERLSVVTDEEAAAEGVGTRAAFVEKWDTLYGGTPFFSQFDPWVWVVAFRRLEAA